RNAQPPGPASGRASPRHDDAQPSRAEGERGAPRDEHLEAVTEPGGRHSERGQGTGAA
ncbi:hypothetical protein N305_08938, partial [Manacus vitellinus]